jgi:FKBP-type peptidyl-prolyl cis-trans isomerase FkpA
MADKAPDPDAPEWKPGPGDMKVWDVKEGDGEPCKPGAQVVIHYTGWTTDGSQFDSSRSRGEPADFALANLIRGWQEGIPGMKPGGIRRLKIPSEWGYGARGSPPKIPGGATLLFEVKLLSSR